MINATSGPARDLVEVPEVAANSAAGDRGDLHGCEVAKRRDGNALRASAERRERFVRIADDVDRYAPDAQRQRGIGTTDGVRSDLTRSCLHHVEIELGASRKQIEIYRASVVQIGRDGHAAGQVYDIEQACGLQPGQGAALRSRDRRGVAQRSCFASSTSRQSAIVLGLRVGSPSSRKKRRIRSSP